MLVGAVLQGPAELTISRHDALGLVPVTPLALLVVQLAAPESVGPLLDDQLPEPVLGGVLGVAAARLSRPRTGRIPAPT